MNYELCHCSRIFKISPNGSVLDKVDKLHLKRSYSSPESSTVIHVYNCDDLLSI